MHRQSNSFTYPRERDFFIDFHHIGAAVDKGVAANPGHGYLVMANIATVFFTDFLNSHERYFLISYSNYIIIPALNKIRAVGGLLTVDIRRV